MAWLLKHITRRATSTLQDPSTATVTTRHISASAASAMGGPGCLDQHHSRQPQGYNFSANGSQANTGHPFGHSYRDGQGYGGYRTYDGGYYRGY